MLGNFIRFHSWERRDFDFSEFIGDDLSRTWMIWIAFSSNIFDEEEKRNPNWAKCKVSRILLCQVLLTIMSIIYTFVKLKWFYILQWCVIQFNLLSNNYINTIIIILWVHLIIWRNFLTSCVSILKPFLRIFSDLFPKKNDWKNSSCCYCKIF